jgi:hypothetical protein
MLDLFNKLELKIKDIQDPKKKDDKVKKIKKKIKNVHFMKRLGGLRDVTFFEIY